MKILIFIMVLLVTTLTTTVYAENYALLINGGGLDKYSNYYTFSEQVSSMYLELIDTGFDQENIIVLDSDGPDNTNPKPSSGTWPGHDSNGDSYYWWIKYHVRFEGYQKFSIYFDSPKDYDGDGDNDEVWGQLIATHLSRPVIT